LLSQEIELTDSECEVCKAKFEMKFVITTKCAPKEACKTGFGQILFLPLLFIVFAMLILIIYILSERLATVADSDEERGYTSALIVVCLLSAGVILLLIANSFKEALCVRKMHNWHIQSQELHEEPPQPNTETPIKEEISLRNSTIANIDQSRPPTQSMQLHQQNPSIVVVPEVTRVRGVRVRTPTVSPGLQAIQSANPRVQAFFVGSFSPSESGTPPQPYFPDMSSDARRDKRQASASLSFDEDF
jgi:hypothetical protein